jgi:3-dehydroquinate dehydratase-2
MKILVINGPNINLLGLREPAVYGNGTYAELLEFLKKTANENQIDLELFQSNVEGAIVDIIQWAYGNVDGIVINPAAYTHTSVALLDALKAVSIPAVEVHISDPETREDFRHVSYVRMACVKTIVGKGFEGYKEALLFLKDYLNKKII